MKNRPGKSHIFSNDWDAPPLAWAWNALHRRLEMVGDAWWHWRCCRSEDWDRSTCMWRECVQTPEHQRWWGDRLETHFLTVCMNREVSDLFGSETVVQLDCSSLFIVSEEFFDTHLDLSWSASRFECAFEEVLRECAVQPEFDDAVSLLPEVIIVISW